METWNDAEKKYGAEESGDMLLPEEVEDLMQEEDK